MYSGIRVVFMYSRIQVFGYSGHRVYSGIQVFGYSSIQVYVFMYSGIQVFRLTYWLKLGLKLFLTPPIWKLGKLGDDNKTSTNFSNECARGSGKQICNNRRL